MAAQHANSRRRRAMFQPLTYMHTRCTKSTTNIDTHDDFVRAVSSSIIQYARSCNKNRAAKRSRQKHTKNRTPENTVRTKIIKKLNQTGTDVILATCSHLSYSLIRFLFIHLLKSGLGQLGQ